MKIQEFTNQTNYHSHTQFCDGRASAEDMILKAIESGFYSYGISSHAPLPFTTTWSMDMDQLPEYIKEIERLRSLYADRIQIYSGLEIDYLDESHNPASSVFAQLPLDFRIGSVHMLEDNNGEIADIDVKPDKFAQTLELNFGGDLNSLIRSYFIKYMTMIENGGFDILGHCDKISMNASYCRSGVTLESWYKVLMKDYLHYISTRDLMIEINTKAFESRGLFFPNVEYFRIISELRIPVMVNSDSHDLDKITSGRSQALQALKDNGIKYVRELIDGQWRDVLIR